jgi:hypothetical protein
VRALSTVRIHHHDKTHELTLTTRHGRDDGLTTLQFHPCGCFIAGRPLWCWSSVAVCRWSIGGEVATIAVTRRFDLTDAPRVVWRLATQARDGWAAEADEQKGVVCAYEETPYQLIDTRLRYA